jgi:hypothetical protein
MTDMSGSRKGGSQDPGARMSAAAEKSTDMIRNALQASQEYNSKLLEFAMANSHAAVEYFSKLGGMKTPSEFIELTTRHLREQSQVLAQQGRELAEISQKLMPRLGQTKEFS